MIHAEAWGDIGVEVVGMGKVRWRSILGLSLAMAMLFTASCGYFAPPDGFGPPSVPPEGLAERNVEPSNRSEDPFPLYLGARWVYRNATPDVNPELHAGALIETDVAAIVRCADTEASFPYECYVLRTRQGTAPEILSYLHRTSGGVDIYGVEEVASTGAPELTGLNGRPYIPLPLRDGLAWEFSDRYGISLESVVMGQEFVPVRDTVLSLLGPYTSSFGNAWRVKWQFGGPLADAYGQGTVETWHAPGVGVVKRSAESLFYELVELRPPAEVLRIGEKLHDAPYHPEQEQDCGTYYPARDTVVVFQFRGASASASSDWRWEVKQSSWNDLTATGVLSPLWEGDRRGEFFPDIAGRRKLDTGSCVFAFKVLTAGYAEVQFERSGVGAAEGFADVFAFEFGGEEPTSPIRLSEWSVSKTAKETGATATFKVHYQDADGEAPTESQVVVYKEGEAPSAGDSYPMYLALGKFADGDYTSSKLPMSLSTRYYYYFEFSNESEPDARTRVDTFDIGGAMP